MQTRHVIARFAVVASLTLAAIAAPSTALADPTASHITEPADPIYVAYTAQTQAQGYSDFQDAGSCGLCDGYLLDPLTYKPSNPLWWGNAALYRHISYGGESSRSEVQVDGVNVYDPGALSGGSVL